LQKRFPEDALGNIGSARLVLGEKQQAIELFDQQLTLARQIKDSQNEVQALDNLGLAYLALGNYPQSVRYYQQRLAHAPQLNDHQGEAQALEKLGNAYYALSNYPQALNYYEQHLALARALKDRQGEGRALRNLGNTYESLGKYLRAIDYHQQHLALARALKDREEEESALGNLGAVYLFVSNYPLAIDYQQQSLAIARELKDRKGEGVALGNLGLAYWFLGNYPKAIDYQQQSLVIAREVKNRRGEGKALGNLGNTYSSLGNYPKAIDYEQQSLAIAREIKDPRDEGKSLGDLGNAYLFLGNYSQAINYQQQHLAIARRLNDRQGEGNALGNLAMAYGALNNYNEGITYQQQALAIFREIKDGMGEGGALNNLGVLFLSLGKPATAETALFQALEIWELLRFDQRADQQKISLFETQQRTYRLLQQSLIAQNKINSALEIAERGRARAFVELLTKRLTTDSGAVITDKSNKSSDTSTSSFIANPTVTQIIQIAKAQNATLVQYSRIGDESLYLWVVKPTGEIAFRPVDLKAQTAELENLVFESRDAIGARGRADVEVSLGTEALRQLQEKQTQNLKQLHQLLIEPIADLLPKDPDQRVIFVPQGELFLIPFPALLDANGKALIEKHTILTAPSIQVLELTHKKAEEQKRKSIWQNGQFALVVGNPTMPKVTTRAGDTPVQLPNLLGAKREAMEIAFLLNTKAITDQQATKAAIIQQMPNARFIHLATHGLLDDFRGLGLPGAIALAPSGNGELNDGLLTADEILDMKLKAELVVLSACDTGRGRITGDGVIGLSRSLIAAGVPSIIVSLWKVPDDSTALLMTEFYKNLQRSPNKAQALRQAMLITKQKYPDPLNWAAFTLIGEAE
jgi:CHAT domain-containing protein